jgi:putative membrane protein
MPINVFTWLFSGALMAFGSIVPGLSPSNLLLFLQLYEPMTQGIASLNFGVIMPLGIGGVITVLAFSRLMAFVFKKAHGRKNTLN